MKYKDYIFKQSQKPQLVHVGQSVRWNPCKIPKFKLYMTNFVIRLKKKKAVKV